MLYFEPMSTTSNPRIGELAQQARLAMAMGRLDVAARGWDQVLALAPDFAEALLFHGQQRLQRGDARGARDLFLKAVSAAPKDPVVALNLSFAHHALGDANAEMTALVAALAADPYCYPALFAQGALLERQGRVRQAAEIYRGALKIVPAGERLAPALRVAVAHARIVMRENIEALDAFLNRKLGSIRAKHAGARLQRFDEAKDAVTGRKKIFVSEPALFNFPQLPSIPFHDRDAFPWLPTIEAQTDVIRDEMLELLRTKREGFKPYIHYSPGMPLNQWEELNNSPRWSALYLWERGRRNGEYCAVCPRTIETLAQVPLHHVPGIAPDVLFSALQPHTRIPPHNGISNTRLLVHLPLVIPEKCGFRVGNDTREWKVGAGWVFDDTIEHEAWNDSDVLRVIMIFEVWNPGLSEAERELATALISAYYEFQAAG